MEGKLTLDVNSDANKLAETSFEEYCICSQLIESNKNYFRHQNLNSPYSIHSTSSAYSTSQFIPRGHPLWNPFDYQIKTNNQIVEVRDEFLPSSFSPANVKSTSLAVKYTQYQFDDSIWKQQGNRLENGKEATCSSPLLSRYDPTEIEIDKALITSDMATITPSYRENSAEMRRITAIWNHMCHESPELNASSMSYCQETLSSLSSIRAFINTPTRYDFAPKTLHPEQVPYLLSTNGKNGTKKRKIASNTSGLNSRKLESPKSDRTYSEKPLQNRTNYVRKRPRTKPLPRSKTGCWTCRIRHKACPENKPICGQCLRLNLICDYSEERPPYMYIKELGNEKLKQIKEITKLQKKLNASKRAARRFASQ